MNADTDCKKSRVASHFPVLDGVRAICSISLVMFHTLLVSTAHIPLHSTYWSRFHRHALFGVLGLGACQVDVLLVVSGLLLGLKIRKRCELSSITRTLPSNAGVIADIWEHAIGRALRLWPVLFICVAFQALGGDITTTNMHTWAIATVQVLSFLNNYCSLLRYGSFMFIPSWSVAVDFQAGAQLMTCVRQKMRQCVHWNARTPCAL